MSSDHSGGSKLSDETRLYGEESPGDIETVGKYRIVETLGEGGMGVVYLAENPNLKNQVAVKTILGQYAQDPYFRRKFFEEGEKQATLRHPNILTVHDSDADEDQLFLVTEYADGGSLRGLMKQRKLDLQETISIVYQLAQALAFAHGNTPSISHLDIKPENVLFADGRPKLADFGIARIAATEKDPVTRVGADLRYAPPEQLDNRAEPKSDVYALGLMFWEMLLGRLPARDAVAGQPDRRRVLSTLPGNLRGEAELIADCLRLKAARRPSMEEVARRLSVLQRESPDWRRLGKIAGSMTLVLAIGLGLWRYSPLLRPAEPTYVPLDRSIAVLPLGVNTAGGDQADWLFSELIEALGETPGIRVTGERSARYFQDSDAAVSDIATLLNVEHVLRGMFAQRDNGSVLAEIRVNVPTRNLSPLERTYEVPAGDVAALLDEIMQDLFARVLKPDVTTLDARPYRTSTTGLVRQTLFEARRIIEDRRLESFEAAETLILQATRKDTTYAPAWTQLASTRLVKMANHHAQDVAAELDTIRGFLIRARDLGDDSADYHGAMVAFVRRTGLEMGWTEDLEDQLAAAYKQTVERNPGHYLGPLSYAIHLRNTGRTEEAQTVLRDMLVHNPLHRVLNYQYNRLLSRNGAYDESIERGIQLTRWYPDYSPGFTELAGRYSELGRYADAWRTLEQAPEPHASYWFVLSHHTLLDLGDIQAWRAALNSEPGSAADLASRGDYTGAFYALMLGYPDRQLPAREGLRALELAVCAGLYEEAVALDIKTNELGGGEYLALAHHQLGETAALAPFLDALAQRISSSSRLGYQGYNLADVYHALFSGDKVTALRKLEEAVDGGWRHGYGEDPSGPDRPIVLETLLGDDATYLALMSKVDADLAVQRASIAPAVGDT